MFYLLYDRSIAFSSSQAKAHDPDVTGGHVGPGMGDDNRQGALVRVAKPKSLSLNACPDGTVPRC